jgi:peroxin-7
MASIPIHAAPSTPAGAISPIGSNRQAFAPAEALTHDWNKYRDTIVATAGVDRLIRTFDIRNPKAGPVSVLGGHEYAIRKLAWSPHLSDVLLSASYDMTCRVWTDGSAIGASGAAVPVPREMGRMGRHTEFVTGVDWCLFGAEGWCASVGWDERLLVWDVRAVMGA